MAVEQSLGSQDVTFQVENKSKERQFKSPCRTGEDPSIKDEYPCEETEEVSSVERQEMTLHTSPDRETAKRKSAGKQERTRHKSPRKRTAEKNYSSEDSETKRLKTVTQFKKIAPAPPQKMLVFIPANAPNDKVVETVSPARQGIQELYGRLLAERLYSLENLELQRNARLGIEEIISKYEQLDNDS